MFRDKMIVVVKQHNKHHLMWIPHVALITVNIAAPEDSLLPAHALLIFVPRMMNVQITASGQLCRESSEIIPPGL